VVLRCLVRRTSELCTGGIMQGVEGFMYIDKSVAIHINPYTIVYVFIIGFE